MAAGNQKMFDDWKARFPDASEAEIAVVREQYGLTEDKPAPKTETKKD